MNMQTEQRAKAVDAFGKLYDIIAKLRSPEGCPWDREQSPQSIEGNLVEEAYELIEAIHHADTHHIEEELGDLYLLVTMMAYMFEEEGSTSVASALDAVCDKLVRRHPHVFGDAVVADAQEVVGRWKEIKEKVEGRRSKDSILDSVSRGLPPLERSLALQAKAAEVGFDWPEAATIWAKVKEELAEAEEAFADLVQARARAQAQAHLAQAQAQAQADKAHLTEELGDLLTSVINLSRALAIDPGVALHLANEKFLHRFRHIEKRMSSEGKALDAGNFESMDYYWNEAKTIKNTL